MVVSDGQLVRALGSRHERLGASPDLLERQKVRAAGLARPDPPAERGEPLSDVTRAAPARAAQAPRELPGGLGSKLGDSGGLAEDVAYIRRRVGEAVAPGQDARQPDPTRGERRERPVDPIDPLAHFEAQVGHVRQSGDRLVRVSKPPDQLCLLRRLQPALRSRDDAARMTAVARAIRA